MSASNEKKNRTEGVAAKRAAAAAEEAKKSKKFMRNTISVIVAVVILLAAALVIDSDLLYTRTAAVTVGNTKFSPAEVNYFYNIAATEVYNELQENYGGMASSYLTLDKPLSQQSYFGDPEMTWADFVMDRAVSNMQNATIFYDAAVKEGYTLSEEYRTEKEDAIANMELYASLSGTTLNKYLAASFGKGMDSKLYAGIMDKLLLAEDYSNKLLSSIKEQYTAEDLAAYYAEHADEFNYLDYYAYAVNFASKNFDDMETEAKRTAAHEAAEKIAAAGSEEEFISLVREFAGEDANVNVDHNNLSNILSSYKDWVTDPARVEGDTAVFDTDTCSYAMYFVGLDTNDYPYVDMRHILIKGETDDNGVYTEESMDAAKARCEELLAEWEADPTEEHFSEMANEYSEDAGSNTTGGLYENVVKHQMVPGINSFLYEEGHQVGDVAVVLGESSAYAGYHLVYYSAVHENLCDTLARNAMTTDAFNAKYDELKGDGYEIVKGSGMKYAAIS